MAYANEENPENAASYNGKPAHVDFAAFHSSISVLVTH